MRGLELNCNQDHLVCPLQSITCHCVVIGNDQLLAWKSQSQLIVQFTTNGQTVAPLTNANYTVTFKQLENDEGDKLSSNLSFTALLQTHPMTIQCLDIDENTLNFSYSIVGRL